MKLQILKGTTSKSIDIFIRDSSQTDGRGLTGLVFNTASLVAYQHRPGSAAAAITLATLASATAAWSSGGFIAVDGTNMPGLYRLDLPDAVLAAGVDEVVVMLRGAANMEPVVLEIQLVSVNLNDGVRLGLTSLANAAAGAVGGVFIRGTGAGAINQDANGRIDVNVVTNASSAIVQAGGRQEVNVSHFGGTAGTFSGGIAAVNTVQWRGTQPNLLTTGRVECLVGAMATDVLTATAIAADAFTAAKVASDVGTEFAAAFAARVIETEGSYTVQQALSICLSVLAGRTTSGGNTFQTANGNATRVAATTNGSNERTAMTLTPSA